MLKMEDDMVQYFTDRLQYRVVEMLGSEWMVKEIGSAEFYHSLEITNFIAFFLQFHYFCCLHDDSFMGSHSNKSLYEYVCFLQDFRYIGCQYSKFCSLVFRFYCTSL